MADLHAFRDTGPAPEGDMQVGELLPMTFASPLALLALLLVPLVVLAGKDGAVELRAYAAPRNGDMVAVDADGRIDAAAAGERATIIPLHVRKADSTAAQSLIDKALTIDPKSAEAHRSRAILLLLQKKPKEAVGEFKAAADLSPPRSSTTRGSSLANSCPKRCAQSAMDPKA